MQKRLWGSSALTAVLFVLAAALLGFGTIGAVQAAPRIESQDYRAEVVLTNIETAITEYTDNANGFTNEVTGEATNFVTREGDDDLLTNFLLDNEGSADAEIKIGKTYPYQLAVRNIAPEDRRGGGIPQFVRVTVYKYWEVYDENGNLVKNEQTTKLDPSLIKLHFPETDGWKIDEDASTDERTVLYYSGKLDGDHEAGVLNPGDDSPAFTDTLTIDSKVMRAVNEAKTEYKYGDVRFRIKASVDAVQTHNATPAMTSAWGRTNVD